MNPYEMPMRCPKAYRFWTAKRGPDYRAAIGVPGGFASQYLQADEVWPSLEKLSIFPPVRVLDCCPVENATLSLKDDTYHVILYTNIPYGRWCLLDYLGPESHRFEHERLGKLFDVIVFTLACSTKIMHRTLVERWWMPAKQVGGLSLLGRALLIGEGRFLLETSDGPAASVL